MELICARTAMSSWSRWTPIRENSLVVAMGEDHRIECEECGEMFDPRSLVEVGIHLHDGAVPFSDIVGERVDD